MALPATENFSTPDDDPLTDRAGWSQPGATNDSGKTSSGNLQDDSGNSNDKSAYWDADAFNNDQYGRIVVQGTVTGVHRLGIGLRLSAGNDGLLLRFRSNDGNFEAFRWDSGGARQAFSGNPFTPSATVEVNDIIRAEISGTTLTLKVDYGSGLVTETTWDASAGPSSGSVGLYIVSSDTTLQGDDWEGGNLAAPSAAIMNQLQYSNLGSDLFNGTLQ